MKIDYEVREDGIDGEMLLGGFKKDLEITDLEHFSKKFEEFMSQYRKNEVDGSESA